MAFPIQVVTLKKNKNNKWKAQELSDGELGEHQQMIGAMEDEMREVAKNTFVKGPTDTPIPGATQG